MLVRRTDDGGVKVSKVSTGDGEWACGVSLVSGVLAGWEAWQQDQRRSGEKEVSVAEVMVESFEVLAMA